jgi:beta-galactosidase
MTKLRALKKTLVLTGSVFIFLFSQKGLSQPRKEYLLQDNWKFTKGDPANAAQPDVDTKSWESLRIPHDWAIKGPFDGNNDVQEVQILENHEQSVSKKMGRTGGLPFIGTGWYRRQLSASYFKAGQRAVLLFDGAMSYPKVYINGKEAGHWAYGYSSFSVDITSFLKAGEENTLAVRLENLPEASRWYPGAGLYI